MKTTLFQDIEIEYSRQLVPLLLRNSLMLVRETVNCSLLFCFMLRSAMTDPEVFFGVK